MTQSPVNVSKRFGNVQKCLSGLTQKGSLATSHTSDRAGAFSEVTGGRASSFHDLSVGEATAPSEREGNGEGGKFPSQISRRKDKPGRLGTQEKVPALSRYRGPMSTLLNVTKGLGDGESFIWKSLVWQRYRLR